jgi:hypothetical protein
VREVIERLEELGVPYYVTGSEALGRYGEPRQTMDLDLVVDLDAAGFGRIAPGFDEAYLIAEPVDFGGHVIASLISKTTLDKVDLILDRTDAWARSAMARRQRFEHPRHGPVWIASLEDLILAKLEWSEGVSELQLRDCRNLIVVNRDVIDWEYVERFASVLGIADRLAGVRDAP